jgi:hypothetical protein
MWNCGKERRKKQSKKNIILHFLKLWGDATNDALVQPILTIHKCVYYIFGIKYHNRKFFLKKKKKKTWKLDAITAITDWR